MIDPKFDKLPEKTGTGVNDRSATGVEEDKTLQRAAVPRQGLSINDTVASEANLSTGGRGVDVSGVRAGSGAGAGSSFVTPGNTSGSPAPNVAPGPTGSGTTPLSDGAIEQTRPEANADTDSTVARTGPVSSRLSHEEVAAHAYRCWHERGCPEGSPEVDWQRAEAELSERAKPGRAAAATA